MRRFTVLLLILSLLLSFSGCRSANADTVSFYYCRNPEDYQYFNESSVIRSEEREIPGHQNNLQYLMSLYLVGPMDEGLVSPLPRSTRLLSVTQEDSTVVLTLSEITSGITDAEFSLAGACLTLTCISITGCTEVTVISADRTLTMNADSILLADLPAATDTTEGG